MFPSPDTESVVFWVFFIDDDPWWEAATSCPHALVFQQLAGATRSRRPLAPIHPPSMPLATSHRPLHRVRVRSEEEARRRETSRLSVHMAPNTHTHSKKSCRPAGVCFFFFLFTFNLPLLVPCVRYNTALGNLEEQTNIIFIVCCLIQTN